MALFFTFALLLQFALACSFGKVPISAPIHVVDSANRPVHRADSTLVVAQATANVPAEFLPAMDNAASSVSQYFNLTSSLNAQVVIKVDYLCQGSSHPISFEAGSCDNGTYTQSAVYMQQNYRVYCSSVGNGFHGVVTIDSCSGSTFYTGLDGTAVPANSIDLVSALMHQFVHVVGFRTGVYKFLGSYFSLIPPTVFDVHGVYDNGGSYEYGSNAALSSSYVVAGPTYFEENPAAPAANSRMQLYTPSTYDSSIQLHHWANSITQAADELFAGSNLLMKEQLPLGSSIRVLGDNTVRALSTMGFSMRNCSAYTTCDSSSFGVYCYWCPNTNTCGDPSGDACSGAAWTLTCPITSTTTSTSSSSSSGGSSSASTVASALVHLL